MDEIPQPAPSTRKQAALDALLLVTVAMVYLAVRVVWNPLAGFSR
jgi:hypothetical protein